MPKSERPKVGKAMRHNPLADEILEDEASRGLRRTPRTKLRRPSTGGDEEEGVLPAKLSQKVLEVVQAQKADEEDDDFRDDAGDMPAGMEEEDIEVEEVEVDEDGFLIAPGATDDEERALSLFLPNKGAQKAGPTLADIILQKIQEHEARKAGPVAGSEESGMSPKVIQVYGEIGRWLKHYKSGKLPKAFKVIPSLNNWEEVLSLTNPLNWSPAAMYEASVIFVSNLNPRMAQRFFNLVLLPAVRQDIAEHRRLNFHYYRALRKALFKPAAFFKGVVLPLAMENCTLREALILSSILGKASIPPMHGAATIVRLCAMSPWYGTTSVLLTALINKKYNLPLKVCEILVAHFHAFTSDSRALPLVWHRCLLVFVQRYKTDLSDDQRRRLKEVLRVHFHESVGNEIRREILAGKGEVPGETGSTAAMEMG